MPTTSELPACMMPDGGDPCKMFTELQEENERLRAIAEAAAGLIEEIIAEGTHQRWKRVANLFPTSEQAK